MCADEAQAKFLPPMAFECKGSKRDEAVAVEVEKKGDAPSCKDIKDRKECRNSKAVCSWCEGKFGGQAMCADEAQAKFLPPVAFTCEPSKRGAELFADEDDDDEEDVELILLEAAGEEDEKEDSNDLERRGECDLI